MYQPFTLVFTWLAGSWDLLPLLSVTRGVPACVTIPGKDADLKLEVRFLLIAYHFRTIIKLKNHHSGTSGAHEKSQVPREGPPPVHPGSWCEMLAIHRAEEPPRGL